MKEFLLIWSHGYNQPISDHHTITNIQRFDLINHNIVKYTYRCTSSDILRDRNGWLHLLLVWPEQFISFFYYFLYLRYIHNNFQILSMWLFEPNVKPEVIIKIWVVIMKQRKVQYDRWSCSSKIDLMMHIATKKRGGSNWALFVVIWQELSWEICQN